MILFFLSELFEWPHNMAYKQHNKMGQQTPQKKKEDGDKNFLTGFSAKGNIPGYYMLNFN